MDGITVGAARGGSGMVSPAEREALSCGEKGTGDRRDLRSYTTRAASEGIESVKHNAAAPVDDKTGQSEGSPPL